MDAFIPEKYIADGPGRIEAYKRIAAIQTAEDAADVLDELIDRYGDPPPSVSDLVNVSLVRVQASTVGVTEVTQKKDTLTLQLESLELPMIRGLLVAFNGRVTAGAGNRPYLSVTLQPDEKPLELLQSILKRWQRSLPPPSKNKHHRSITMKKRLLALICALALVFSLWLHHFRPGHRGQPSGDFEITSGMYLLAQYGAYQQPPSLPAPIRTPPT